MAKKYQFLTIKPVMYVANLDEKGLDLDSNSVYHRLTTYVASRGGEIFPIAAKLENELKELTDDEAKEYREMLGYTEVGLTGFVRTVYDLLDLITFYTFVGGKEIKAWALKRGSTLLQAAELIHSDIAKGFVKAEVVDVDKFLAEGADEVKRKGEVRIEGKEYVVNDGDVVTIKFRD